MELTTLQGVGIAEIDNASDRAFSFLLNKPNTATFQVPISSDVALPLMSMRTLLKVYYGADLVFHGPIIGANRVATSEARSIAVTASDPLYRLTKRLGGKNPAGTVYNIAEDRGAIAVDFIDATNAESDTGIRTGTLPFLSGSSSTYSSGPYKPISEIINDLGMTVYGFDWEIVPIEYAAGKIGDWRASPFFGVQRPDVIFEYGPGTGANIKEATDTVDATTQANRVFHIGDTGPDTPGLPTVSQSNAEAIALYGLFEDVAQAQLYDPGLRQALVDEHVNVRKWPRRVVTFRPREFDPTAPENVPVFGVDYLVGDFVKGRAEDELGTWFDAMFRVWGWTARPSNEGLETGDLLLVDEGGA